MISLRVLPGQSVRNLAIRASGQKNVQSVVCKSSNLFKLEVPLLVFGNDGDGHLVTLLFSTKVLRRKVLPKP